MRQRERGKLKVYIGSAAGTGKTYRMLQEAHDLRRRGVGTAENDSSRREAAPLIRASRLISAQGGEVSVDEGALTLRVGNGSSR